MTHNRNIFKDFSTSIYSYRFSFNGKEKDNEVKGDGNSIAFEDRIYDPRLSRFLSLDPLQSKFPDVSPYNFAINCPISIIDYKGRNPIVVVYLLYEGALLAIEITASYILIKQVAENAPHSLNANKNPNYDWQKKQERTAEGGYRAQDIAFKKIWADMKKPEGGPNNPLTGAVIGVWTVKLLMQLHKELERMEEITMKQQETVRDKITTIEAKGENQTVADKKQLNNLTQQSIKLDVEINDIKEGQKMTKAAINAQNTTKSTDAKPDATYQVPPITQPLSSTPH